MVRWVMGLFALVLVALPQAAWAETGFLDRTVRVDGKDYAFQVYVPRKPIEGRKPVILALHGGGERGSDGLLQTEVGLAGAIRRNPERWPAIVVFPQTPKDTLWMGPSAKMAMAALAQAEKEFRTDPDRVYLAGLSLGGNVAAAGGQLRSDLFLAAPMSPAFGIRFAPNFLTPALTRLILGLPDIYIWWDPINRENFQAESGYPGFSLHALGQIFRLGLAVIDTAKSTPPTSTNQLLISNWGDPAVNLGAIDELAAAWSDQGGSVATYRFPLIPWLPHDIISTDAVGGKIDVTYPKLLELLTAYP